jgi:hypothetical protein
MGKFVYTLIGSKPARTMNGGPVKLRVCCSDLESAFLTFRRVFPGAGDPICTRTDTVTVGMIGEAPVW